MSVEVSEYSNYVRERVRVRVKPSYDISEGLPYE